MSVTYRCLCILVGCWIVIVSIVILSWRLHFEWGTPLRLRCWSVDVFQIWSQLECLVDLGHIAWCSYWTWKDTCGLFAFLRLFTRHVNARVVNVASRIRSAPAIVVFGGLCLIIVIGWLWHNMTSLRQSSSSWEVLTISRLVFLHVFAPIWIDHDICLTVSGLRLTLSYLLLETWWICTRHWFTWI